MNLSKLMQQAGEHLTCGDALAAETLLKRVLKKTPTNIDALNLAGLVAYQRNDFARAVTLLSKVIKRDPQRTSAHLNLGVVFNAQKRHDDAEAHYRAVLQIEPGNVVASCNLGKNFLDQNNLLEAERWLNVAVDADPNYWLAQHNLGACLQRLGKTDEAVGALKRALALHSNPESLSELIATLRRTDRFAEEYALSKQLLAMPAAGDVAIGAWETLFDAFDWEAINASQRNILSLLEAPDSRPECRSSGLMLLNSLDNLDAHQVYDSHRGWAQSLPSQPNLRPSATTNPSDFSRLRIGYLSPDFREHSVGFFIRHVIQAHDKDQFAIHCYSNSNVRDALTDDVITSASAYIEVTQMSDAELGQKIHNDRIDILIDLAGHTRDSRLAAMSSRLAPVQISYLGYPNTSGLDTIDYRITDPYADVPNGTQYSETLLTLPESFLCFGHFDDVEFRKTTPAAVNARVTFGSFNNIRKITPTVVATWSEILNAVPGSRLVIKSRRAGEEITQRHLRTAFSHHGVSPSRIEMLPVCASRSDHLTAYNHIDIALDTFPYHGTTTSCEALWMGVPVITLVGFAHPQRASYSILKNLGLDDLACSTKAEYRSTCVELARDPERLSKLRAGIHDRVARSILCDPKRFTRQFEEALIQVSDARTRTPQPAAVAI